MTTIFLMIIFTHWIADFVAQNDRMAIGKSSQWGPLLEHTALYTLIWMVVIFTYGASTNASIKLLWFLPITFICHTATDYYTSRVNAQLWKEEKRHQFFVSIGFDQVLHYVQLWFTFKLLL